MHTPAHRQCNCNAHTSLTGGNGMRIAGCVVSLLQTLRPLLQTLCALSGSSQAQISFQNDSFKMRDVQHVSTQLAHPDTQGAPSRSAPILALVAGDLASGAGAVGLARSCPEGLRIRRRALGSGRGALSSVGRRRCSRQAGHVQNTHAGVTPVAGCEACLGPCLSACQCCWVECTCCWLVHC